MNSLCVVFDLDDTLYLESDYVWSGFRALEAWVKPNLGIEDFCLRAWARFQEGERRHVFDRILEESGIEPNRGRIQTMLELYRGHMPDIQLAADAAPCLQDICGQVQLALVTDGAEESQRNKIKALGLEETFEAVVLTSTLGNGCAKPHLKGFLEVRKQLGSTASEYIYVGDNPTKDFIGPRSLGWRTIRIRRDGGLYSHLEAARFAGADLEMPDLNSLANTVIGR